MGRSTEGFWPPERKMVDDGYRTVAFPFDELAPPVFAIEELWTRDRVLDYLRSWSATQKLIQAGREDAFGELTDELSRAWNDANAPRRVRWPLRMRVGRSVQ